MGPRNFGGRWPAPPVGANAIALVVLTMTGFQHAYTIAPFLLADWARRAALRGTLGNDFVNNMFLLSEANLALLRLGLCLRYKGMRCHRTPLSLS